MGVQAPAVCGFVKAQLFPAWKRLPLRSYQSNLVSWHVGGRTARSSAYPADSTSIAGLRVAQGKPKDGLLLDETPLVGKTKRRVGTTTSKVMLMCSVSVFPNCTTLDS